MTEMQKLYHWNSNTKLLKLLVLYSVKKLFTGDDLKLFKYAACSILPSINPFHINFAVVELNLHNSCSYVQFYIHKYKVQGMYKCTKNIQKLFCFFFFFTFFSDKDNNIGHSDTIASPPLALPSEHPSPLLHMHSKRLRCGPPTLYVAPLSKISGVATENGPRRML